MENYPVTVPTGATKLVITLTGTGGDGDLYVKKTAQPTLNSYDFRSDLSGSNESVTASGTTTLSTDAWYVSVYGYSAATFTIKVVAESVAVSCRRMDYGAVRLTWSRRKSGVCWSAVFTVTVSVSPSARGCGVPTGNSWDSS